MRAMPFTEQGRDWRDAVTPMGLGSRRRWVMAFPSLLMLAAVLTVGRDSFSLDGGQLNGIGTLTLAALVVAFGMLRRGSRRLAAGDHEFLDERDVAARDRAFRLAYPLLMGVLATTMLAILFTSESLDRQDMPDLLAWIVVWWVFLPTGILAWREPPGLPAEPDARAALTEPVRDAVFALAFLVGLAVALTVPGALWAIVPVVLARITIGELARRSSGRPPLQRQTVAGIATGLVATGLLVLVVTLVVAAGDDPSPPLTTYAIAAALMAAAKRR